MKSFRGFGGVVPMTIATPEQLDAVMLPGGRKLPPSYRDYAENLGYGLTCGLFLIYIPMGDHCDCVTARSEVLARVNQESVAHAGTKDFEPDGNAELVLRLFPFAASENGDVLGWDLEDERDGEYTIYRIGPRAYGMRKAGRSLHEFIECCLDARIKQVMGPGYEPLEATFKPLVPA